MVDKETSKQVQMRQLILYGDWIVSNVKKWLINDRFLLITSKPGSFHEANVDIFWFHMFLHFLNPKNVMLQTFGAKN